MDKKRILLVDDEEPVRRLLGGVLEKFDYEVVTADNGREGLQKALARRFDLIVVDLMMPRMDGKEVIAELRANPATLHIPVMVLTSGTTRENIVHAAGAGADYVFAKAGFNLEHFMQKVEIAMEQASHRDEQLPRWLNDTIRKLGLDPIEDFTTRP